MNKLVKKIKNTWRSLRWSHVYLSDIVDSRVSFTKLRSRFYRITAEELFKGKSLHDFDYSKNDAAVLNVLLDITEYIVRCTRNKAITNPPELSVSYWDEVGWRTAFVFYIIWMCNTSWFSDGWRCIKRNYASHYQKDGSLVINDILYALLMYLTTTDYEQRKEWVVEYSKLMSYVHTDVFDMSELPVFVLHSIQTRIGLLTINVK